MLSRYTSDEMAAIWSDQARYERWRLLELAVLAAQVRAGTVPAEVLSVAESVPVPTAADVEAVEAVVRHDVVAFLDAWTAGMDASVACQVHRVLTSSDTADTAQALALVEATDVILTAGQRLVTVLADRALEHRASLCVARTHGQAAAFDVVGHRFADLAFATDRALARLAGTRAAVAVVNVSGPVGTGVDLPAALVRDIADTLGLGVAPVTTQVVFRDAIAAWVSDLALMGAVCESVATDIRLGQHDGVAELAEPRQPGQVGSSAMPHKRNPVTAENITGIARLLRGYVGPALEDVALWQHRDISHSSVERVVLPDAAALCEHALVATARMVSGLVIDLAAIQANIDRAGGALATSRLQATLQSKGFRRMNAAEAVRERVSKGLVSTEELEAAATQVLQSEALAATFDRLVELRARHASLP
jgi:adenylosuccinate lyase